MKKTLNKGFTLIELLVVIAIIGILASVILASHNSARAKGTDAAVKSDLENARPQAEIYYDGNANSYGTTTTSVCAIATSAAPVGGIQTMLADAASKIGGTYVPNGAVQVTTTPGTVNCNSTALAWAASAPTKAVAGFWCVDSTGQAKQEPITAPLGAGAVKCL